MRLPFAFLIFPVAALALCAQNAPDSAHRAWRASWITHPAIALREPVVLHFRRAVTLTAVPASYPVRVSADNRFILYVNGQRVGDGPARGDLAHWRYERFDLAPLLKAGPNLITATVWNFGIYAPLAQISDRTAFLLESEATGASSISTPEGWLVEVEQGERPMARVANGFWQYMAAGWGEEIDGSKYDWSWNDPGAVLGASWVPAASPIRESIYPDANKAQSAGDAASPNAWALVPDELPKMEYALATAGDWIRTSVVDGPTVKENKPGFPITIQPNNQRIHLLFDRKTLTTAYPRLTVSGGKGAKIRLTYSEALYDKDQHKGDRDDVGDRKALGLSDSFLPDGGAHRSFEPLWWRTWRYLDIEIETGDEPLTLESLTASFTAYPFERKASFHSGDAELDAINEISWRTARLDAHETYMDTPYYEQFQYLGDTRIQALISYAVAGDDRLARQAITAFDQSRTSDGLTMSRYPSSLEQIIPTFSLLWIGMVHDYWMYRPDPDGFVQAKLEGVRAILNWYAQYREPKGLLHKTPWWSFVDWVGEKQEIPSYDGRGVSCVTSLHYLGALEDAADLEAAVGDPNLGGRDREEAQSLRAEIGRQCWNAERALIADNPDQKIFSQQANILAVLYDVIPEKKQAWTGRSTQQPARRPALQSQGSVMGWPALQEEQEVLRRMLVIEPGTSPDGIMSASYYFRFYLARALEHAGMADEYLNSIDPWRKLLPLHFSTWPETPGNTRSDSHAWSAHPIYDLLTLVAGIEPASPGFKTVRIAPHLGNLPTLQATFPHPQGTIEVNYQRQKDGLTATISLPGNLTGTYVFNGISRPLKAGVNQITIP
jgi:hypothetical protein